MLTVSKGYDPRYLTAEVGRGAEGYYLSAVSEQGEPEGIWTGRGCETLGLTQGSAVSERVMHPLYGKFIDPRDPRAGDKRTPDGEKAHLGQKPRSYKTADQRLEEALAQEPGATPERRAELELEARKSTRQAVYFYDATFSVQKSVSLLHASLQAAGREDEAKVVWDGIMAGNQAGLEYLQNEAGYSRAGYHGREVAGRSTGRYVDAHDWVVASFAQHTSRDGDPQLHVHNAILNRLQCDDGAWRSVDGRAVFNARPAAAAIAERATEEYLSRELGVEFVSRPDGKGREAAGISEKTRDLFSARRRAVKDGVATLASQYEQANGRAPSAWQLQRMAQFVTLDTREGKSDYQPERAEFLARWEAQAARREGAALSDLPEAALYRRGAAQTAEAGAEAGAAGFDPSEVIRKAVAEAGKAKATWNRYDLIRAINTHLPDSLGGLSAAQTQQVLEELADAALAGREPSADVVALRPPELIPAPSELRRADGESVYERHGADLYATDTILAREQALLESAAPGAASAPRTTPETAAARLEDSALRGAQRGAVEGILTSGRDLEVLNAAAGTGKSKTVGELTGVWQAEHGQGTVLGLSLAQNAANVMRAEGVDTADNIDKFLYKYKHGQTQVAPGGVVIVDEAGMVPTRQLAQIHHAAQQAGAKLLLTGDDQQLSPPEAGGAFPMLARENGASVYQLDEVHRFASGWEGPASLRIRDGDTTALQDYENRGRLVEGEPEAMQEQAYQAFLADHLAGKQSLLLTSTNETAAELASHARADLVRLGTVEGAGASLRDGNRAGVGDLVQARENNRRLEADTGRWVVNRDVYRITGRDTETGALSARLDRGRDPISGEQQWGTEVTLPGTYVGEQVELAYASTTHAAQGRTVDTAHAVVDENTAREQLYVMLTRGRESNVVYTALPPAGPEDPATGEVPDRPDRFAVLAGVLERENRELAATETLRAEADRQTHLGHLGAIWAEQIEAHTRTKTDARLVEALGTQGAQAVTGDDAYAHLLARVRSAEADGHDGAALLSQAAGERDLTGARSPAAVLTSRLERHITTAEQARADEPHRQVRQQRWRDTQQSAADIADTLQAADRLQAPPASADSRYHQAAHDQAAGAAHAFMLSAPSLQAETFQQQAEARHPDPAPDQVEQARPWQPRTYAERTPELEGIRGPYLRTIAQAMDNRAVYLGEEAAEAQPSWASTHLGAVPDDPLAREEWTRRAGAVAAYREQYGHEHETDPLGPAPAKTHAEAHTAWQQAHTALGSPETQRDYAAETDGVLLGMRDAWAREQAWAPPYVAAELAETSTSARTWEQQATRARAEAQADPSQAGEHERKAEMYERWAGEATQRRDLLEPLHQERQWWYEHTTPAREAAEHAETQLHRRGYTSEDPEQDDAKLAPEQRAQRATRRDYEPGAQPEAGREAEPEQDRRTRAEKVRDSLRRLTDREQEPQRDDAPDAATAPEQEKAQRAPADGGQQPDTSQPPQDPGEVAAQAEVSPDTAERPQQAETGRGEEQESSPEQDRRTRAERVRDSLRRGWDQLTTREREAEQSQRDATPDVETAPEQEKAQRAPANEQEPEATQPSPQHAQDAEVAAQAAVSPDPAERPQQAPAQQAEPDRGEAQQAEPDRGEEQESSPDRDQPRRAEADDLATAEDAELARRRAETQTQPSAEASVPERREAQPEPHQASAARGSEHIKPAPEMTPEMEQKKAELDRLRAAENQGTESLDETLGRIRAQREQRQAQQRQGQPDSEQQAEPAEDHHRRQRREAPQRDQGRDLGR